MKTDNTLKILGFFALMAVFGESKSWAEDKALNLTTTHPQVAAVLNQIKSFYSEDEFSKNWQAKSLYGDQVNVHDFEPTIKDLKNLLKQANLVAGPIGDQKWLIAANAQGLLPSDTLFIKFPELSNDHFWLYEKAGCEFESQINKYLVLRGLLKTAKDPYCKWIKNEASKIGKLLKESGIEKVVLAHSALAPLLTSCGLEVLTLMQHDHDREVAPKTLKKLTQWLRGKQTILAIKEKGFPTPHQLKGKNQVVTLEWSPLQTRPQPLESLFLSLKEALQ